MEFKRGDIIEAVQPIRLSNGFILQTRAVGEIIAQSTDKQTVSVQFECYSGAVSVWTHLVALVDATAPTAAAQGEVVDTVRQALAEMDRLAAIHIQKQGDPKLMVKEVWEAEDARDKAEHHIELEARRGWLRELLAVIEVQQAALQQAQRERDAAVDAMRTLQNAGLSEVIKDYQQRLYTVRRNIGIQTAEKMSDDELLAIINGLQCIEDALAASAQQAAQPADGEG